MNKSINGEFVAWVGRELQGNTFIYMLALSEYRWLL